MKKNATESSDSHTFVVIPNTRNWTRGRNNNHLWVTFACYNGRGDLRNYDVLGIQNFYGIPIYTSMPKLDPSKSEVKYRVDVKKSIFENCKC